MSFMDILNSIALWFTTWATPSKFRELVYHASGTETTCSIQSFFVVLGFALPCYNAMLCLHYLCVIKFNMKDEILVKYEKFMHAFAILVPLGIATLGLCLNLFHPSVHGGGTCLLGNGCDLSDLLLQQQENMNNTTGLQEENQEECTPRPPQLLSMMRVLLLSLSVITFITITVSMSIIYCFVRSQAKTMKKYHRIQRRGQLTTDPITTNNDVVGSTNDHNSSSFRNNSWRSGCSSPRKPREQHTEALIQSSLYVAAYMCTFIIPFTIGMRKEQVSFGLKVLEGMFYPLQGFWNFICYVRPKFLDFRTKTDKSFFCILKYIIMGTSVQDLRESNRTKNDRQKRKNHDNVRSSPNDDTRMKKRRSITFMYTYSPSTPESKKSNRAENRSIRDDSQDYCGDQEQDEENATSILGRLELEKELNEHLSEASA